MRNAASIVLDLQFPPKHKGAFHQRGPRRLIGYTLMTPDSFAPPQLSPHDRCPSSHQRADLKSDSSLYPNNRISLERDALAGMVDYYDLPLARLNMTKAMRRLCHTNLKIVLPTPLVEVFGSLVRNTDTDTQVTIRSALSRKVTVSNQVQLTMSYIWWCFPIDLCEGGVRAKASER